MGSYGGAELCESIGIYVQSQLFNIVMKNDSGLYRDDIQMKERNKHSPKTDRSRCIIKMFKYSYVIIDIKTNLKIVDFLDSEK